MYPSRSDAQNHNNEILQLMYAYDAPLDRFLAGDTGCWLAP